MLSCKLLGLSFFIQGLPTLSLGLLEAIISRESTLQKEAHMVPMLCCCYYYLF